MLLAKRKVKVMIERFWLKAKMAREESEWVFGNTEMMAFHEGKARAWQEAAEELDTLLRK